jgi:hypothetical protein
MRRLSRAHPCWRTKRAAEALRGQRLPRPGSGGVASLRWENVECRELQAARQARSERSRDDRHGYKNGRFSWRIAFGRDVADIGKAWPMFRRGNIAMGGAVAKKQHRTEEDARPGRPGYVRVSARARIRGPASRRSWRVRYRPDRCRLPPRQSCCGTNRSR